jgi:putative tryptophan/tyrosine transport system permease protein
MLAQSILELGSLYGFVVLATCISFRFVQFPDLTVEGSFLLGATISARLLQDGSSPWLTIGFALLGGVGAGWVTACLHVVLRVNKFFAGILTSLAIYSLSFRILGQANVPTLRLRTVFEGMPGRNGWVLAVALFVTAIGVVLLFFHSHQGLRIRGMGWNPATVAPLLSQRIWLTAAGLGLANGLAAVGGALVAQSQGSADLNMNLGVVIGSFAALFVGEAALAAGAAGLQIGRRRVKDGLCKLTPSWPIVGELCAVLLGTVIYRFVTDPSLYVGFDTPPELNPAGRKWFQHLEQTDVKLVTAVVFAIGLVLRRRISSFLLVTPGQLEK